MLSALIILAVGGVLVFYGLLGVDSGRRYNYVRASLHEALSSAPNRAFRLPRAQNWLCYRTRRPLLWIGGSMLAAGGIAAILITAHGY